MREAPAIAIIRCQKIKTKSKKAKNLNEEYKSKIFNPLKVKRKKSNEPGKIATK